MHGLLSGLDKDDLQLNEHGYLDWVKYRNTFGWFSVSKIRDKIKASNYVTKYITKTLHQTNLEAGQHSFFASQHLKRKRALVRLSIDQCPIDFKDFDFQNEFCKVKWFTPKGGETFGQECDCLATSARLHSKTISEKAVRFLAQLQP
jgi:hypothetical protein